MLETRMATRDELHTLVDLLPEVGLEGARRYLEALKQADGNPAYAQLLLAPEDDEPTTPDEDEVAREAWNEYLRGEAIPAGEAKRRLLR